MSSLLYLLEGTMPRALGWAIVHFLWQGALISVVLWALLKFRAVRTANGRYLVCGLALAICVLATGLTFTRVYHGESDLPIADAPASTRGPDEPGLAPTSETGGTTTGPGTVELGAGDAPPPVHRPSGNSWVDPLLPWMVITWSIGVLLLSMRLLGAWAFTQHLKHRLLKPVPDWLSTQFNRLRELLGINKLVRIFESAAVESPIAIGWLRPVVLLPACAITGLSPEQLDTILAHELAHIRRHDYLINLLQSLAETALFFHPGVWWISARLRDEREHCCDDIAISACGHELEYAEALAALAERRHHTAQFALAATGGSLLGRIQRILAGSGPAVPVSRPAAAFAGVLMISLLVTVVAQAYIIQHQRQPVATASPFGDISRLWPERYRKPVTMVWERTSLRVILADIASQTGLVVPLPDGAGDELLTLRFDGAPLHLVLDAVLSRVRISWRLVGKDQIITTPWESREYWVSSLQDQVKGHETEQGYFLPGLCPIVYSPHDARLESVAQVIGAQMGTRITIPRDYANKTVTCTFHNTFAREALKELLTPMKLDYRILNDAEIEVFKP